FDLADTYRNPVLVMTDGEVGHMRERIVLPEGGALAIRPRRRPTGDRRGYVPFRARDDGIPAMADFGTGFHTYVTGLTHDERGLPATDDAAAHTRLVERLCRKISDDVDRLTRVDEDLEDGARVGIVSYGISSRAAAGAVRRLRAAGNAVSHLRLVTVFPFPERLVRELASRVDRLIVPEMNLGQICHVVREAADGAARVERVSKIGGEIIEPAEIVRAVLEGGEPVEA
ncbi:MAG: 2-oxoacid:acceptor oxidoreductase subunit alpha, partial [Candidatus Eiseniibacteriota bacterium]